MSDRKELNFEINLLPVISLLAVLICFLLLTTAWYQIGHIETSQALGGDTQQSDTTPPSLWAELKADGKIELSLKDIGKQRNGLQKVTLVPLREGANWDALTQYLNELRQELPDVTTALIFPDENSRYEDVVRLMDVMKRSEMKDIGISPVM